MGDGQGSHFYLSAMVLGAIILGFALHSSTVLKDMGLEVIAILGATVMLVIYPTDVEGVPAKSNGCWFWAPSSALRSVGSHGKADVLAMIGEWLETPLSSGLFRPHYDVEYILQRTHRQHSARRRPKCWEAFKHNGELTWFAEYGHLLWWSLIFGVGLGGITPIGSAHRSGHRDSQSKAQCHLHAIRENRSHRGLSPALAGHGLSLWCRENWTH